MASTFLTRLRVGPILVDAKGVNRLYRSRVRRSDLLLFIAAAFITMGIIVAVSEPLRAVLGTLPEPFRDLWFAIRRLFG